MVWAHTDSSRSPYSLTQLGMPIADASFLSELGTLDIGHPAREVLPALEARLA
jgi:hypothetical protein